MEDFIKLKSNKDAMKLVFKKFSKITLNVYVKEDLSFDEFMKTNPDSELQSIYFLLSTVDANIGCDIINFIEDNLLKLNKQAKIDSIKQMIRNFKLYTFMFEKIININDIYVTIFQKFSGKEINIKDIIKQLIDGEIPFKDIQKVLSNFKDEEIQSLFCIYIFFQKKGRNTFRLEEDILSLNKSFQIDILIFFSIDIILDSPTRNVF